MSHSDRISTSDMAAVVRLANELHELSPNPVVQHEHMLRSLAKMLGAQVGVSIMGCAGPSSSPQRFDLCMLVYHGWENPQQRAAANDYFRTMTPANPVRPRLVKRCMKESPATYRREQLVDDDEWYRSPYVERHHRAMGVDHGVYSVSSMDRSRVMTGIAMYREADDQHRFTDRDRVLLRMFHSQAQWMYECEPRATGANSGSPVQVVLSPRQKQTLRLLLCGDAEKQIATKLSLSRHTVHEHVKAIYRSIGVSSRGELLSKFLHRG